jgi:hypothetical protein
MIGICQTSSSPPIVAPFEQMDLSRSNLPVADWAGFLLVQSHEFRRRNYAGHATKAPFRCPGITHSVECQHPVRLHHIKHVVLKGQFRSS